MEGNNRWNLQTHTHTKHWCHYLFSCTYTNTQNMADIFSVVWLVRMRAVLVLWCVCAHICDQTVAACVCLQMHSSVFLCFEGIHTSVPLSCLSTHVCVVVAWVWVCPPFHDLPLCAHILLLNWHTGHLSQPDAHLDVSELQTKVFPQDGHSGPPLARTRLREQLDQQEDGGRDRRTGEEDTENGQKNRRM